MQTIKHAVISAAGMGSRLGMNMPKCLVDIGDKKIIDYQLELLKDVEDVRIVVGFMEEKVIDYVRKIRDNVIFVRNPDYRTTTNSYSVYLATHNLIEPFLSIDGDLLIEESSFNNFISHCDGTESIIGITKSKTEEAVFTRLDEQGSYITEFFRQPVQPFEWSGIAYIKDIKIMQNGGYLYRELEKHLPLKAIEIDCYEIDTPEDLSLAVNEFKSVVL